MRVAAPPGTPDFYGSMAQTPPEATQMVVSRRGMPSQNAPRNSGLEIDVSYAQNLSLFCIVSYFEYFLCDFFFEKGWKGCFFLR